VNVTGEAAQRVEVKLQVGTQSEMVTVRGERERGEVEAINVERTADNIIQVLPNEVITSLPNTNIADAVGRLPSVSLARDEGASKTSSLQPRASASVLTRNSVCCSGEVMTTMAAASMTSSPPTRPRL